MPPTSWRPVLKARGASMRATRAVGTAISLCCSYFDQSDLGMYSHFTKKGFYASAICNRQLYIIVDILYIPQDN